MHNGIILMKRSGPKKWGPSLHSSMGSSRVGGMSLAPGAYSNREPQQQFWQVCVVEQHYNQAGLPQSTSPCCNAEKGEHPPGTASCPELPVVLLPRHLQWFGCTPTPSHQGWGFGRAGLEWHLPSSQQQRVAAPTL